jgi:hypothetical protein
LGLEFLMKSALVNALHGEHHVGPLNQIRGNRRLRVRTGARGKRFDPLIAGEDGFRGGTSQAVPAADKEQLSRDSRLRQGLLPHPQLVGFAASAGAAAGSGAGAAAAAG